MNLKKKAASLMILISVLAVMMPMVNFRSVNAASYIKSSSDVKGSDFTSSAALAKKLDSAFAGNIGLYTNSSCTKSATAKLGASNLTGSNRYYIKSGTSGSVTYGWQCYIYANGFYNTLFNEWVGNGSSLKNSEILLTGGNSLSYSRLSKAGVKCGAYVRTTNNKNGKYSGSGGHSFVILSYSEDEIVYAEGNANGRGLVRVTKQSWSELNKAQLSGRSRYLCHVVQPTASYYNSLYGTASSGSASTASKTDSGVSFNRTLSYKKSAIMQGEDVKYIQTCLKTAGYTVTVNGKYDTVTLAAVKKFQSDNGLTADGKIGSKTWPKIVAAAKAAESKKTSDVKDATKSITSLKIKTKPSKLTYTVGDSLNTSGLKLTATYSDKSTKEITSGFTCDVKSFSKAGTQKVTVSYGGKSATFDVTVKVNFSITSQPKNVTVKQGKTATFSVKTSGSGLSYQWYYKKAGASGWSKWNGHTTATTSAAANASWNGMKVYCVVKDSNGNTVSSDAATIKIA